MVQAHAHLKEALALYDPEQRRTHTVRYGQDSGVVCGFLGALILLLLGYPDQALRGMEAAVVLAQRLAHPFTLLDAARRI